MVHGGGKRRSVMTSVTDRLAFSQEPLKIDSVLHGKEFNARKGQHIGANRAEIAHVET